MRLDPPRSRVLPLLLGVEALRGALLIVPAVTVAAAPPEPPRRRPAAHPFVNRRQPPRPKIYR